jgi:hypothetical protein
VFPGGLALQAAGKIFNQNLVRSIVDSKDPDFGAAESSANIGLK